MEHSLSVILPVYNAEDVIAQRIAQLLEVLPDLTTRFEIWVVDDGSTDHTEEIVYDLRATYPQLRLARHPWQRGMTTAVQTGMARSMGDIIFVQEEDAPISATDMRRLWMMRLDEKLVMARAQAAMPAVAPFPAARPKPLRAGLLDRLGAWGDALRKMAQEKSDAGGIHMIRREAVDQMRDNESSQEQLSIMHLPGTQVARNDGGHVPMPQQTSPSFLKNLRDLAVGE